MEKEKNVSNPKTEKDGPVGAKKMTRQTRKDESILPSFASSAGSFIIEVVKVIVIALAIIVPVRYFLMQPFYVKGASMEPNFHDNEYLIIDELTYRLTEPRRGEVIVFRNPRRPSEFYIKRIIGLPSEKIEINHGEITITNNDFPSGFVLSEEKYLPEGIYTSGSEGIQLGEGEFYVMGDNRASSLDSRSFGAIKEEEIIGRIWIRAWPFHKVQHYSRPELTSVTP
ncbi:MAG: signal peptidase I [bacterium]